MTSSPRAGITEIELTVAVKSRRVGHSHRTGATGVLIEHLGGNAWLAELRVPDETLEGDAWYETVELTESEFRDADYQAVRSLERTRAHNLLTSCRALLDLESLDPAEIREHRALVVSDVVWLLGSHRDYKGDFDPDFPRELLVLELDRLRRHLGRVVEKIHPQGSALGRLVCLLLTHRWSDLAPARLKLCRRCGRWERT